MTLSQLRLAAVLLLAALVPAQAATTPAASMHELRDQLAACFQPASLVPSTRVTFYFSLNTRGGLIGRPRTTFLGFAGTAQERAQRTAQFTDAFTKCLPVALDRRMAAGIPGEVYFLQFVVGADGHEQQVLLRPFGSHGGVGPVVPGPAQGPELPEAQGPDVNRFRPFRPQPGEGPFFHPPVYPRHLRAR